MCPGDTAAFGSHPTAAPYPRRPPPLSNAPSAKGRQIQSPLSPSYGAFTTLTTCYAHEKMSKADSQVIVFQALRQIERSSMSEEHGPINCRDSARCHDSVSKRAPRGRGQLPSCTLFEVRARRRPARPSGILELSVIQPGNGVFAERNGGPVHDLAGRHSIGSAGFINPDWRRQFSRMQVPAGPLPAFPASRLQARTGFRRSSNRTACGTLRQSAPAPAWARTDSMRS